MQQEKEMLKTTPDKNREWIAPQVTVLTTGATATGLNPNTVEAFSYHPS